MLRSITFFKIIEMCGEERRKIAFIWGVREVAQRENYWLSLEGLKKYLSGEREGKWQPKKGTKNPNVGNPEWWRPLKGQGCVYFHYFTFKWSHSIILVSISTE